MTDKGRGISFLTLVLVFASVIVSKAQEVQPPQSNSKVFVSPTTTFRFNTNIDLPVFIEEIYSQDCKSDIRDRRAQISSTTKFKDACYRTNVGVRPTIAIIKKLLRQRSYVLTDFSLTGDGTVYYELWSHSGYMEPTEVISTLFIYPNMYRGKPIFIILEDVPGPR